MEEVSALAAIFCGPGEFDLISDGSLLVFELKTTSVVQTDFAFQLRVSLDSTYPSELPKVMIHSQRLHFQAAQNLIASLTAYLLTLQGTPMLLDMVQWCQEHAHEYAIALEGTSQVSIRDDFLLRLFLIDHVRNEKIYHKTLDKMCRDCHCNALLLEFRAKRIYLLVGGEIETVKEFSKCFSQVNIDLDSQARPCKERMKKLLGSIAYSHGDFSAQGFLTSKHLGMTFHEYLFECSYFSQDLKTKILSVLE